MNITYMSIDEVISSTISRLSDNESFSRLFESKIKLGIKMFLLKLPVSIDLP